MKGSEENAIKENTINVEEINETQITFYLLLDYFVTIDDKTSLEIIIASPNQTEMQAYKY